MKRWMIVLPLLAVVALLAYLSAPSGSAHAAHLPTAGQPHIALWQGDAPAAISFTFDDGLQAHADIAAPLLHEFGFVGTFYVVAGLHREHKSDPAVKDPRFHYGEAALSWDEIRGIRDLGMEIGNHSLTHAFLNHITDDRLLDQQINHAADIITREIGQPPLTFAFPYNEYTPHDRELALVRHLAVRENWTDYGGPRFTTQIANGLVEKAIHDHAWLVPMVHGIDGGFLPLSSHVFREALGFIKSHQDSLWVSTYADIASYQLERRAATLHVQDSGPGETTFFIAGKQVRNRPLTVILPLPLNENSDDVVARVTGTETSVPMLREAERILVDLPPETSVTVTWH